MPTPHRRNGRPVGECVRVGLAETDLGKVYRKAEVAIVYKYGVYLCIYVCTQV